MSLQDSLKQRILHAGPLTIADYMAEALSHPKYGYYMSQTPFGREGDFITAPETSQMFGELLGFWCAALWQQMGSPEQIKLVELGPGRGTLMSDALRAAGNVPGFKKALSVHLVETSPALRQKQKEALTPFDVPLFWHERFSEVSSGPSLILANELFDALPIRQYSYRNGLWHEVMVDWDQTAETLRLGLSPLPVTEENLFGKQKLEAKEGDVAELCPLGLSLVEEIGGRVAEFGGGALVVDYGYARSALGDTLQAMKSHKYHPILETPGQADLTAHVDFEMLGAAAQKGGAAISPILAQGEFLKRLGIEMRAQALLKTANAKQQKQIESALHRLIDPKEMGSLFKVLALTDPKLGLAPGF